MTAMLDKGPLVREVLQVSIRKLSTTFGLPCDLAVLDRLEQEGTLLAEINKNILTNQIFRRRRFDSIYQFSVYRNLVYYLVRVLKPRVVVETGVLHGLTSSWILKALADNGSGELVSIDLPRQSWNRYFPGVPFGPGADGEIELGGTQPGWVIPESLRSRWQLLLGPSTQHLESVLAEHPVDLFIHDSDHSYETMRFECTTAFKMAPNAMFVIDDFDLNSFFFEHLATASVDYMFMDEVDDSLRVKESTSFCRFKS